MTRDTFIISGYLLSGKDLNPQPRQVLYDYMEQGNLLYFKNHFFSNPINCRDYNLTSLGFEIKVLPDNIDDLYAEFLEMLKSNMFFQARLYIEGEDSGLKVIDYVLEPNLIPTIASTISSGSRLESWQVFKE